MIKWLVGIGITAIGIVLLVSISPRPMAGSDGIVVVQGNGRPSAAAPAASARAGQSSADEPRLIRQARARMLAQPPGATMLEDSLKHQLGFIGDVAGAPTTLSCREATCMLVGTVRGDETRLRRALAGTALRDTLASWQFAPTTAAILPATGEATPRFILVIDRID